MINDSKNNDIDFDDDDGSSHSGEGRYNNPFIQQSSAEEHNHYNQYRSNGSGGAGRTMLALLSVVVLAVLGFLGFQHLPKHTPDSTAKLPAKSSTNTTQATPGSPINKDLSSTTRCYLDHPRKYITDDIEKLDESLYSVETELTPLLGQGTPIPAETKARYTATLTKLKELGADIGQGASTYLDSATNDLPTDGSTCKVSDASKHLYTWLDEIGNRTDVLSDSLRRHGSLTSQPTAPHGTTTKNTKIQRKHIAQKRFKHPTRPTVHPCAAWCSRNYHVDEPDTTTYTPPIRQYDPSMSREMPKFGEDLSKKQPDKIIEASKTVETTTHQAPPPTNRAVRKNSSTNTIINGQEYICPAGYTLSRQDMYCYPDQGRNSQAEYICEDGFEMGTDGYCYERQ